ncbi:MAG TPA: diguanylate cyclase [Solirubrobacteraceae bacterium]|nr:diguanylate cyclase [Solirubrobacteraceae bacterium]
MRAWLLGARRARNIALLVLWALCVGAPATLLAQSQARNAHGVQQRFGLRASIAASFASAFVQERLPPRRGQTLDRHSRAAVLEAVAPLGRYLESVVPLSGAGAYVVDRAGMVIVSNAPTRGTAGSPPLAIDPTLARATARAREGSVDWRGRGESWFASRPIAGTPWRVVIAAPSRLVFQTVRGPAQWVAWVMLFAFALLGLCALAMFDRLISSRQRLTTLNRELDRVARIDSLTEIHNRRHIEEALRAALGAARRRDSELALLLVDIDRFKQFNDSHGHLAGDRALRHVASRLADSLRVEDVIGRWGGEEFIVVLPGADAECAVMVAERLRARISSSGLELGAEEPWALTVTIGVSCWSGQDAEDLVNQADRALYRGKGEGRNLVRLYRDVADDPDVVATVGVSAGSAAPTGENCRGRH